MSEQISFTGSTDITRENLAANIPFAVLCNAMDGDTIKPCLCTMTLFSVVDGQPDQEIAQYIGSDGQVYNPVGGKIRVNLAPATSPCIGTLTIN